MGNSEFAKKDPFLEKDSEFGKEAKSLNVPRYVEEGPEPRNTTRKVRRSRKKNPNPTQRVDRQFTSALLSQDFILRLCNQKSKADVQHSMEEISRSCHHHMQRKNFDGEIQNLRIRWKTPIYKRMWVKTVESQGIRKEICESGREAESAKEELVLESRYSKFSNSNLWE